MRGRPVTVQEIAGLFQTFGIAIQARLQQAKAPEEAQSLWDAALKDAKVTYRELAMKLHPDRNPEAEEDMKAVNEAWDRLNNIRPRFRRPPPPMRVVNFVVQTMTVQNTVTAVTTDFGGGMGSPFGGTGGF